VIKNGVYVLFCSLYKHHYLTRCWHSSLSCSYNTQNKIHTRHLLSHIIILHVCVFLTNQFVCLTVSFFCAFCFSVFLLQVWLLSSWLPGKWVNENAELNDPSTNNRSFGLVSEWPAICRMDVKLCILTHAVAYTDSQHCLSSSH